MDLSSSGRARDALCITGILSLPIAIAATSLGLSASDASSVLSMLRLRLLSKLEQALPRPPPDSEGAATAIFPSSTLLRANSTARSQFLNVPLGAETGSAPRPPLIGWIVPVAVPSTAPCSQGSGLCIYDGQIPLHILHANLHSSCCYSLVVSSSWALRQDHVTTTTTTATSSSAASTDVVEGSAVGSAASSSGMSGTKVVHVLELESSIPLLHMVDLLAALVHGAMGKRISDTLTIPHSRELLKQSSMREGGSHASTVEDRLVGMVNDGVKDTDGVIAFRVLASSGLLCKERMEVCSDIYKSNSTSAALQTAVTIPAGGKRKHDQSQQPLHTSSSSSSSATALPFIASDDGQMHMLEARRWFSIHTIELLDVSKLCPSIYCPSSACTPSISASSAASSPSVASLIIDGPKTLSVWSSLLNHVVLAADSSLPLRIHAGRGVEVEPGSSSSSSSMSSSSSASLHTPSSTSFENVDSCLPNLHCMMGLKLLSSSEVQQRYLQRNSQMASSSSSLLHSRVIDAGGLSEESTPTMIVDNVDMKKESTLGMYSSSMEESLFISHLLSRPAYLLEIPDDFSYAESAKASPLSSSSIMLASASTSIPLAKRASLHETSSQKNNVSPSSSAFSSESSAASSKAHSPPSARVLKQALRSLISICNFSVLRQEGPPSSAAKVETPEEGFTLAINGMQQQLQKGGGALHHLRRGGGGGDAASIKEENSRSDRVEPAGEDGGLHWCSALSHVLSSLTGADGRSTTSNESLQQSSSLRIPMSLPFFSSAVASIVPSATSATIESRKERPEEKDVAMSLDHNSLAKIAMSSFGTLDAITKTDAAVLPHSSSPPSPQSQLLPTSPEDAPPPLSVRVRLTSFPSNATVLRLSSVQHEKKGGGIHAHKASASQRSTASTAGGRDGGGIPTTHTRVTDTPRLKTALFHSMSSSTCSAVVAGEGGDRDGTSLSFVSFAGTISSMDKHHIVLDDNYRTTLWLPLTFLTDSVVTAELIENKGNSNGISSSSSSSSNSSSSSMHERLSPASSPVPEWILSNLFPLSSCRHGAKLAIHNAHPILVGGRLIGFKACLAHTVLHVLSLRAPPLQVCASSSSMMTNPTTVNASTLPLSHAPPHLLKMVLSALEDGLLAKTSSVSISTVAASAAVVGGGGGGRVNELWLRAHFSMLLSSFSSAFVQEVILLAKAAALADAAKKQRSSESKMTIGKAQGESLMSSSTSAGTASVASSATVGLLSSSSSSLSSQQQTIRLSLDDRASAGRVLKAIGSFLCGNSKGSTSAATLSQHLEVGSSESLTDEITGASILFRPMPLSLLDFIKSLIEFADFSATTDQARPALVSASFPVPVPPYIFTPLSLHNLAKRVAFIAAQFMEDELCEDGMNSRRRSVMDGGGMGMAASHLDAPRDSAAPSQFSPSSFYPWLRGMGEDPLCFARLMKRLQKKLNVALDATLASEFSDFFSSDASLSPSISVTGIEACGDWMTIVLRFGRGGCAIGIGPREESLNEVEEEEARLEREGARSRTPGFLLSAPLLVGKLKPPLISAESEEEEFSTLEDDTVSMAIAHFPSISSNPAPLSSPPHSTPRHWPDLSAKAWTLHIDLMRPCKSSAPYSSSADAGISLHTHSASTVPPTPVGALLRLNPLSSSRFRMDAASTSASPEFIAHHLRYLSSALSSLAQRVVAQPAGNADSPQCLLQSDKTAGSTSGSSAETKEKTATAATAGGSLGAGLRKQITATEVKQGGGDTTSASTSSSSRGSSASLTFSTLSSSSPSVLPSSPPQKVQSRAWRLIRERKKGAAAPLLVGASSSSSSAGGASSSSSSASSAPASAPSEPGAIDWRMRCFISLDRDDSTHYRNGGAHSSGTIAKNVLFFCQPNPLETQSSSKTAGVTTGKGGPKSSSSIGKKADSLQYNSNSAGSRRRNVASIFNGELVLSVKECLSPPAFMFEEPYINSSPIPSTSSSSNSSSSSSSSSGPPTIPSFTIFGQIESITALPPESIGGGETALTLFESKVEEQKNAFDAHYQSHSPSRLGINAPAVASVSAEDALSLGFRGIGIPGMKLKITLRDADADSDASAAEVNVDGIVPPRMQQRQLRSSAPPTPVLLRERLDVFLDLTNADAASALPFNFCGGPGTYISISRCKRASTGASKVYLKGTAAPPSTAMGGGGSSKVRAFQDARTLNAFRLANHRQLVSTLSLSPSLCRGISLSSSANFTTAASVFSLFLSAAFKSSPAAATVIGGGSGVRRSVIDAVAGGRKQSERASNSAPHHPTLSQMHQSPYFDVRLVCVRARVTTISWLKLSFIEPQKNRPLVFDCTSSAHHFPPNTPLYEGMGCAFRLKSDIDAFPETFAITSTWSSRSCMEALGLVASPSGLPRAVEEEGGGSLLAPSSSTTASHEIVRDLRAQSPYFLQDYISSAAQNHTFTVARPPSALLKLEATVIIDDGSGEGKLHMVDVYPLDEEISKRLAHPVRRYLDPSPHHHRTSSSAAAAAGDAGAKGQSSFSFSPPPRCRGSAARLLQLPMHRLAYWAYQAAVHGPLESSAGFGYVPAAAVAAGDAGMSDIASSAALGTSNSSSSSASAAATSSVTLDYLSKEDKMDRVESDSDDEDYSPSLSRFGIEAENEEAADALEGSRRHPRGLDEERAGGNRRYKRPQSSSSQLAIDSKEARWHPPSHFPSSPNVLKGVFPEAAAASCEFFRETLLRISLPPRLTAAAESASSESPLSADVELTSRGLLAPPPSEFEAARAAAAHLEVGGGEGAAEV